MILTRAGQMLSYECAGVHYSADDPRWCLLCSDQYCDHECHRPPPPPPAG